MPYSKVAFHCCRAIVCMRLVCGTLTRSVICFAFISAVGTPKMWWCDRQNHNHNRGAPASVRRSWSVPPARKELHRVEALCFEDLSSQRTITRGIDTLNAIIENQGYVPSVQFVIMLCLDTQLIHY